MLVVGCLVSDGGLVEGIIDLGWLSISSIRWTGSVGRFLDYGALDVGTRGDV